MFVAIAEVLFWLYSLGDIETRYNEMDMGLRWARTVHAKGRLFTEATYYDHAAREHRWLARTKIVTRRNAAPSARLAAAYDTYIADQPVIDTLRAEVDRLAALTGSRA